MNRRQSQSRQHWIRDIALGLRDEFNLDHNDALKRAGNLMDRIAEVRPADLYYWPAKSKEERDANIAKEFNGSNLKQVAKKYNVSARSVYNIHSKAIEKRVKK